MIYRFECPNCGASTDIESRPFEPPEGPECECGREMDRVYGARIDTSGCRDHDHVPVEHRVMSSADRSVSARGGAKTERAYAQDLAQKRDMAGNGNRMSHSVPAHLYHGKIKETGDRNYWRDPANLRKHKSCEIKRRK